MAVHIVRADWLKRNFWLILILIFSLFTRLWRLGQPAEYYFDEAYHIPAVNLIVAGDQRAFEWWHSALEGTSNHDWLHPPLAKYFQALSVTAFGGQAWAWRLPSVVFGLGVILMIYLLARQLFKNKKLSLLAAFLVSLDGLILVQSRIGMNDIFVTFWILLGLYFFSRYLFSTKSVARSAASSQIFLTGLSLGLGLATKWSAVWAWLFVLAWLGVTQIKKLRSERIQAHKLDLHRLPWQIFSLVLLPAVIYSLSYLPVLTKGAGSGGFGGFGKLGELHRQIIWYQTHRDSNHVYASVPWCWFLNLRPVWYWKNRNLPQNLQANIYALGNPLLQWLGVGAVLTAGLNFFKKIKPQLLFLVLAYLSLWLPWIFSPRIMFYYHYLPAVPLLAIILAWFLQEKIKPVSKVAYCGLISLVFINFCLFYPHWTGLAVPKNWVERVYFAIESWR